MLPRVNLGLVLEHGHNAIVLPEATAERIVAAFHEWLPRHEQLAAIGAAGREFAQASLTWETAAETVAALYGRVLEAPAAAVPSAAGMA
jgi:glycosyltransferase involved in cell wall biosynthesis